MARPVRMALRALRRFASRRRPAPAPDCPRTAEDLRAAGWTPSLPSAQVGRGVRAWQPPTDGASRGFLLWRTRAGSVVAMDAICPHRGQPMLRARLVGDTIRCPVHGYRFGPDGRCVNVRRARPASVVPTCEVAGQVWLAPDPPVCPSTS